MAQPNNAFQNTMNPDYNWGQNNSMMPPGFGAPPPPPPQGYNNGGAPPPPNNNGYQGGYYYGNAPPPPPPPGQPAPYPPPQQSSPYGGGQQHQPDAARYPIYDPNPTWQQQQQPNAIPGIPVPNNNNSNNPLGNNDPFANVQAVRPPLVRNGNFDEYEETSIYTHLVPSEQCYALTIRILPFIALIALVIIFVVISIEFYFVIPGLILFILLQYFLQVKMTCYRVHPERKIVEINKYPKYFPCCVTSETFSLIDYQMKVSVADSDGVVSLVHVNDSTNALRLPIGDHGVMAAGKGWRDYLENEAHVRGVVLEKTS